MASVKVGAPQLRVLMPERPGEVVEYPPAAFQVPMEWSPDGRWIAYQTSGGAVPAEIWFASAGQDRKLYPVLRPPGFDASGPAFSPDGRYLAFACNETGRQEVYIQEIDLRTPPRLAGTRRRVSLNGGKAPLWRKLGGELFFLSLSQQMMSVRIKPEGQFGVPERLFELPPSVNSMDPMGTRYDADPAGTRFLIVRRIRGNSPHLQAILNWQAGLRQ